MPCWTALDSWLSEQWTCKRGREVLLSTCDLTSFSLCYCRKAAQEFKKKNKQPSKEAPKEVETPPELICGICKELMKDAVIIPCCGESYCYECIQDYLCENEFVCPACKKEGVSPDNLAPNKALRKVCCMCVCVGEKGWWSVSMRCQCYSISGVAESIRGR